MQPVFKTCDHPKISAASTNRPEEIRIRISICLNDFAVRCHHLGCQQIVDRQPILARKEPYPATKSDSRNSHAACITEPSDETVFAHCVGIFACRQSSLSPGSPVLHVDLQPLHILEVKQDSPIDAAVPWKAVTASPDGEFKPCLAGKGHTPHHIRGICSLNNDGWLAV